MSIYLREVLMGIIVVFLSNLMIVPGIRLNWVRKCGCSEYKIKLIRFLEKL